MASIFTKTGLALAVVSLSACATVPSSSPLMAGIDKSAIGQPVPGGLRAASDPVCVNLHKNMVNYVPVAKKKNAGGQFLTSMALGVLASAATGGVVSGINGTAARMAAGSAMSTATSTAGNAAIGSMQRQTTIDEQKIKAADAVSCPMPVNQAPSKTVET